MEYKIKFIAKIDSKEWSHFLWNIQINNEVFDYKMGLGNVEGIYKKPKQPKVDEVLWSIIQDYECASGTFKDFCLNLGYSEDSIKALDIYLQCQRNGEKLKKALGNEFYSEKERILKLDL